MLCVSTFSSIDPQNQSTQGLLTRYFFSQFWCEFTKEVLTEFLNEDFVIQEMQAEQAEKKRLQQALENDEFDSEDDVALIKKSKRRKSQGKLRL